MIPQQQPIINLNNTINTTKHGKTEDSKFTSERERETPIEKFENTNSKSITKERQEPLNKNQKSINVLNSSTTDSRIGFLTTKSNNPIMVKKNILSPIKEVTLNKIKYSREDKNKLIPLKIKFDKPNISSHTSKNINNSNQTFSKITLNPINDQTQSNIFNKLKNEKSIIIEENLKTKESDIFAMTQYDEKRETNSKFKSPINSNDNTKIINSSKNNENKNLTTESNADEKAENQNNNLNKDNNSNNKFFKINKKLEINTIKGSASAIDNSSNINNNRSSSPDVSTKYISINQSGIINNNLSNTNILNGKTSVNKLNLSNDKYSAKTMNDVDILNKISNISLLNYDNSQGKEVIERIEKKVLIRKEEKFPLIPDLTKSLRFKETNPLKTIFFNCTDNLSITNKLFNYIGNRQNKKLKSKTIEKMKKKERELYVERDLKIDMSFKDKVFVYGENGGYYASAEFGNMQKYNLISKISESMAMNNRNFLSKQFNYDYKKDEDYIYKEELRNEYLRKMKEENEKEVNVVESKHKKVDDYLDNTLKKSEILIQRIDNDLIKYERERIKDSDEKKENNDNKNNQKDKKKKNNRLYNIVN